MHSNAAANLISPIPNEKSSLGLLPNSATRFDVILFPGGLTACTGPKIWTNTAENQVWSLTQFYAVDFSPSRIRVKKSVYNKLHQSRFASAVIDNVFATPRLARHT